MADKIESLQDGQSVKYRLGRAGEESVAWGPWREGPVYIARDSKGRVCGLTPMDGSWAEYDPRRDRDGDVLLCEDYYMEIGE